MVTRAGAMASDSVWSESGLPHPQSDELHRGAPARVDHGAEAVAAGALDVVAALGLDVAAVEASGDPEQVFTVHARAHLDAVAGLEAGHTRGVVLRAYPEVVEPPAGVVHHAHPRRITVAAPGQRGSERAGEKHTPREPCGARGAERERSGADAGHGSTNL